MKPRIVMVVIDFPKLSETFIISKFIGLIEDGWDVHLFCARFNQGVWDKFATLAKHPGVRRRIHPGFPFAPRWLSAAYLPFVIGSCVFRAPVLTLRYLRQVWSKYKKKTFWHLYLDAQILFLQPDLIHFEFGALAPQRMYLKDVLGCKVLVSFRGYDLNFVGLDDPQYYEPVWEHADALHLLGDDLWARAIRRGCPPDKTHSLISPGIDLDFFAPPERVPEAVIGTTERPLRILSVGRLEWKKGYEYAFHAVRILKEKGIACEYRVIGDGDYFEPLVYARHQMGLSSIIELLEGQPREVVRDQMMWADVFLHAAVSEGFCNAVVEAQAMGLPVVCSDADGLSENVQDGGSGFVVPRRNPDALAEKLELLSKQPVLRSHMGEAGRQRAKNFFDLKDQVRKFAFLLKELVSIQ